MTKHISHRIVGGYLAALLIVAAGLLSAAHVRAEGEPIDVESSVTSEFPDGFRVEVRVSGDTEIRSIAIRMRVGQRSIGAYEYLCPVGSFEATAGIQCADIEPGLDVEGELFWRTDSNARYIPPGTIVTYNFEIETAETTHETDQQQFVYHDARFKWEEITEGTLTIAYHGPVRTRAQLLLDAMMQTIDTMAPLLGAETEEPIRVTMYNNVLEMLVGLPPGSTTIRRELITAGQAFSEEGTLLTLGSGSDAEGTVAHEITHILVHRAGVGTFRGVPAWLNEGLAEYGNIKPGPSYDIALSFAIANNRLLPVMHRTTIPGVPEDAIIFYGQSRDIVRMMVDELGREKMTELMAVLKTGATMEAAVPEVYGMELIELDNMWRDGIGAPRYNPPETARVAPTAVPRPTLGLYSLTPQAGAQAIGDTSDEPTPTPTVQPEPTPTATSVPIPAAAATEPDEQSKEDQRPATGGGCSAPPAGSPFTADLPTVGLLFGLAGLIFRRRIRP